MNSRFSALLLAGGKSRRMQRDKTLIEIDGEPMWRRQLRILRSLEPNELFIAGPFCEHSCVTLADAESACGPLGGVVAGLRHCSTPLLLVLAVDLPRMTSRYLQELIGYGCVVPEGQPLCAIYPVTAFAIAERCLATGNYSMQEFALQCADAGLVRQIKIDPKDEDLFLNMNTPEDLLALTNA
ncbi:MAG: molybdenum cofactor guanylyltransferase [Chthoniobacterales bacterium]